MVTILSSFPRNQQQATRSLPHEARNMLPRLGVRRQRHRHFHDQRSKVQRKLMDVMEPLPQRQILKCAYVVALEASARIRMPQN